MSQYLPPGCGNTDPYDPRCGSCGCESSAHYYEDGEEPKGNICARDSTTEGIELSASGEITHACDSLLHGNEQCPCEGFVEGEYEPDCDDRGNDLD